MLCIKFINYSTLKANYVNKQTLHQDKHRELNKKTTQEGDAIIEYFEKKD